MENKTAAPIVLLTDFGDSDGFAGVLKGVIAGISPKTKVIDLTHHIRPQDIGQAAFILSVSYSFFPKGSLFCAVVDPGVGSDSKRICIQTRDYYFVGPDNGLFWEAANENTIERIIHLTNDKFYLPEVSYTFHGRDIFAPVSAHIAKGDCDLSKLGPELSVSNCEKYIFPEMKKKGKVLELTVLNVDHFGNIVLNLKKEQFDDLVGLYQFAIEINGHTVSDFHPSYAFAREGDLFIVVSSNGYLEISVKNGSAADLIRPKPLNRARLTFV